MPDHRSWRRCRTTSGGPVATAAVAVVVALLTVVLCVVRRTTAPFRPPSQWQWTTTAGSTTTTATALPRAGSPVAPGLVGSSPSDDMGGVGGGEGDGRGGVTGTTVVPKTTVIPEETTPAPPSGVANSSVAATATVGDPLPRPPAGRAGCSCWTPAAAATGKPCCRRAAISGHKLGTILMHRFFDPYPIIAPHKSFLPSLIPDNPRQDYRHVAFVRNLYSALVSGYLYHKSGRECWLDPYGKPWEHQRNIDWEKVLRTYWDPNATERLGPYPPRKGRSICRYLSDESVEVGMKVYMGFVHARWYHGILPYMEKARKRTTSMTPAEGNKTLLVCLEEASNPQQEEVVFYRLMGWLYPGGHNYTFPGTVQEAAGHGTSHDDPKQRVALLELAKRYDREVFGGVFNEMNGHFKCRETV